MLFICVIIKYLQKLTVMSKVSCLTLCEITSDYNYLKTHFFFTRLPHPQLWVSSILGKFPSLKQLHLEAESYLVYSMLVQKGAFIQIIVQYRFQPWGLLC